MLPQVVAHSDWSMHAEKRRTAVAKLQGDGRYLAASPMLSYEPEELLGRFARTARSGAVLAGFDFPIGLPEAYAQKCGVTRFRDLLPELGLGAWKHFFAPAASPVEISFQRPFFPAGNVRKGTTRACLWTAIGVPDMDALMRRCDLATSSRPPAECMFWTLGPKQVGKGMITGWRDMLAPAARNLDGRLSLWPFDGELPALIQPGHVVVCETYPGEMYGHFGIAGNNKRSRSFRQDAGKNLVAWAKRANVQIEERLLDQISGGFGTDATAEDDFDAVVGLLGMLNVVLGLRPAGTPASAGVKAIEGWMLGLAKPLTDPTGRERRPP